jgi:hypothetical protein
VFNVAAPAAANPVPVMITLVPTGPEVGRTDARVRVEEGETALLFSQALTNIATIDNSKSFLITQEEVTTL